MWLMTPKAFVSIVDKASDPDFLCVRARRAGDIERLFPSANVVQTPRNDYRYRAEIPREEVAAAVSEYVRSELYYDNHKDATDDGDLHRSYGRVWSAMATLQPGGPYGGEL